jgi:hypothetical protein
MSQSRSLGRPLARIALQHSRPTPGAPHDRRQAPRVAVEAPVLAARPGQQGELLFCAEAIELSERGLLLRTPWSLPLRSRLDLSFQLACRDGSREACVLTAEVVRCDREQLAVAFPELRPRQFLRLRDYVWRARGGRSTTSLDRADQLPSQDRSGPVSM